MVFQSHTHTNTHTQTHRHTHRHKKYYIHPLITFSWVVIQSSKIFDLGLKNGGWTTKLGIRRNFVSPLSKLMRQNKSGLVLKPIPVPSVE